MTNPYLWIAVVGGILAFLTGCGVGMNDLANAFGTTYGSRVLTLKQIVLVASICEFAGAVSLGGEVTSTIAGGIADSSHFASEPYVLMYGMLCALGAAFAWLLLATALTLPVSSTHSIAGGIIGFSLVYGGANSVSWAKKKSEFPFVTGVVPIITSWFISPLLTGLAAAAVYGLIRTLVLRPANSVQRALYSVPVIFGVAFFLESFFVLFKGAKSRLHWPVEKALWVAAIIGVGAGIASIALIPLLKRRVRLMVEKAERQAEELGCGAAELGQGAEADPSAEKVECAPAADGTACGNITSSSTAQSEEKVDKKFIEPITGAFVGDAEKSSESEHRGTAALPTVTAQLFDKRVEYVFRYLQVFTAICASFAHGASDVSNAVGPFAAIYSIYQTRVVESKNETPIWILCIGGGGLVLGLATLGVRIMRLLGERITKITPSRGFSAELSTAMVVSFASGYGVPISSTHCITGAVIAISIVDVGFWNVRWIIVAKLYAGWMLTLVVCGLISALFFAQGIYAPSRAT
ncbi:phosphate-repressible phosphate permease, putative [Trypanosoma cruzi]|uniref:Phosphate transporter n=1 Tax=Trypanosoma cruzi (strain CL Brener) TaxID=353153 RepID=Q4DNW6_TRYCC|nr:phosphate-repressible phosphate permease, putative [Trypanosoma cruzi]EAN94202.1 phosphate-repressible phosphate permease, putative [Trypanosoma cruzi]|eukprot:XP_816053.1 phosphate-repressible phosphate permease [Trypanosoma cruzi strain CL Brener]